MEIDKVDLYLPMRKAEIEIAFENSFLIEFLQKI